jgi:hypothetical protein
MKNPHKNDDVRPDARKRFEKAVDMAVKFGPMHRPPKVAPIRSKRATKKPRKSA